MNHKVQSVGAWVGVLSWAILPRVVWAEIDVRVTAEVRVEQGGARRPRHEYVPAERLDEGQEICYTVYVRNTDKAPAAGVAVVRPIPANTRYVADSAAGAGAQITFSTDGGKTFATPDELRKAVGAQDPRASPQRYTHIRWEWRKPLPGGAVALARFRAVFK